jgi:hypothetical protein
VHWVTQPNNFSPKNTDLTKLIDQYGKKGIVSLLGISAGGSAAINAFCKRTNKVNRVVILSSRCKENIKKGSVHASKYPAFRQSLVLLNESLKKLSSKEKHKILTVRGFYDELVPIQFSTIPGASNKQLPMIFHALIIFYSLTIFSKKIVLFLKNE